MAEQVVRKQTYIIVWVALMCLAGLNGGLSFLDLHRWSTVIAFVIPVVQAGLILAFFMHLRYEKQKMVWVWAAVSMFWLAILITMTMNDYVTRGFLRVPGK